MLNKKYLTLLFSTIFIVLSCDSNAQNRSSFSDKINGGSDLKLMNWSNFPPITINSVRDSLGSPSIQNYEEMVGEYTLKYSDNYLFFLEADSEGESPLYSWVLNDNSLFIRLNNQIIEVGDNINILQNEYPKSWNSRDTVNKAFYLFSNTGSDDYLLVNWNNQGLITRISLVASPI